MPFTIERNDLARMNVDAIVVTANEELQITGGAGLAVARVAGLEEMQAACNAIGRCPTGSAVLTPAFALDAQYVVHVVGPIWHGGGNDEQAMLRSAYDSALNCAYESGAQSIALPLISAHTFGFPVRLSFVIAVEAVKAFLEEHDCDVRIVLFGQDAMAVGVSLFDDIAEYIDDHYVEQHTEQMSVVQIPPAFGEFARESSAASSGYARQQPAASGEPGNRQSPDTASEWDHPTMSPLFPEASPKQQRLFERFANVADRVRENVAEHRAREREERHARKAAREAGTCVVRDRSEEEQINGPFLTPEQYDYVYEQRARREGFCPACRKPVSSDAKFCTNCGRELPSGMAEYREQASMPTVGGALGGETDSFSVVGDELDYEMAVDYETMVNAAAFIAEDAFASEAAIEAEYAPSFSATSAPAFAPSAAPMPTTASAPMAAEGTESLSKLLNRLDAPFSTTLLALIDARGFTDAQVYKRANMSRQLFSKIRSDATYHPTKKTVLALAIALGLDLGETDDLLRRAGFALSHSNKADVIVEYFIVNQNHDIYAINEALYAFDQPLL